MYACLLIPNLQPEQMPALRACAEFFSPSMETSGPGLVVFDVGGLRHLFGEPECIAAAIAERASALELPEPRVAIASNPHVAITAARAYSGARYIPPGREADVLAGLPLEILQPGEDLLATLSNWGIRTFAELAALPAGPLSERLGQRGLALQRLARGESVRPVAPDLLPEDYSESIDLDHPLDNLEPLAFVLSSLLHKLCQRLRSNGWAAHELELALRLEEGSEYIRHLRLPFATTDQATFLKLLQFDLSAHPPGAAVLAVRITARQAPPRVTQTGLFLPPSPEAEKLELTLARIAAIVGESSAGSPRLLDTYRPDAWKLEKFQVKPPDIRPLGDDAGALGGAPRLSIRRFRPPVPAEVRPRQGPPEHIHARGIQGKITAYAGPWRSSGDWWTSEPWQRDEWDVALPDGSLYRLFQTGPAWFVDGNYD